jgi:hypothetical protein
MLISCHIITWSYRPEDHALDVTEELVLKYMIMNYVSVT